MIWPFRKKRPSSRVSSFVEATNGGWDDGPDRVRVDGGSRKDYVIEVLEAAVAYADEHGIKPGETFEYTLTNIPSGISSPLEIVIGIMYRAGEYGLLPGSAFNETFSFTRTDS